MANFSFRVLFAHLLAFLGGLQRSFWNYAPQPLLSAISPLLLEAGPKPTPTARVLQGYDPQNYTNSIDFFFQTPSPINLTCSVDHSERAQDDASSVEPELPHFYVSLDTTPVQREDEPSPLLQPKQVEAGHVPTNIDSYGARGLSFCPVLVGVAYLHSLLHLYMLLMIPSFVNHWFEDVSFYESVTPGLLDRSRLLHTSLFMPPWFLVRYGLRRVLRRVTHKSAHQSIPRIVLIRVSGEAIPFDSEDRQVRVYVGERQASESEGLETLVDRDEVPDDGDSTDIVISDDDSFIGMEFDVPPTVSQQGENQRGIADPHDRVGLGSLIRDAKDSQHFVNASRFPGEQWETSPDPTRVGNEPLQHVEASYDFGRIVFRVPGGVIGDDPRDNTNCLGKQEDSSQRVDSSPWRLINDCGPYESETSSAVLNTTSSSVESQDALTPAKNVRFADGDGVGTTDGWQAVPGATHIAEHTSVWDLGTLFKSNDGAPVEIASYPPTDAKLLTQVTERTLQEGSDEKEDVLFNESLSPFLTAEPVVNLPALVVAREDIGVVDVDPVHTMLVEDVATRSPLQILASNVPAVVINIYCAIEAEEEQSLTKGDGELALDQEESLGGEAEVGATSDITSLREDGFRLASPPIEGPHMIYSPMIDSKPPVCDVRLIETALLASGSAAVSETGIPLACSGLFITDTIPSKTRGVPGTNELEPEVGHETPKSLSDGNVPGSPRNDLQELGTSHLGARAEIRATTADSLVEPGTEYVISGQRLDFSHTAVTEPPTMQLPERPLTSPPVDTSILLSTTSVKKIGDLRDGESHKDDITLWNPPTATSQPCPQRTLSGSMHAPSGPDPWSIPRTNGCTDQGPVLYESFPLARSKDGKGSVAVTENAPERAQDLFASVHAPKQGSKSGMPSLDSDLRNGSGRDRCRSVTNPATVFEAGPSAKSSSPNWAGMPEVVDAFRIFKQPHSGNDIRRASSISECTTRGPMAGIVGQKGIATNSLNNASTIANIQGRWMRGGGLLLVRDLVPSDPADFNLRSCTNLRSSKLHRMSAVPVHPFLHPGTLNISPFVSQHETTRRPAGVEADFSTTVPGSTEIRQQQRCRADPARGEDRVGAWFSALDGLLELKEVEVL